MSGQGRIVTPLECALIKVGMLLICLLACCYILMYSFSLSVKFVLHVLLTRKRKSML